MNLYIDIETTGIPHRRAHWEVDYEIFPRPLEIAWKYKNNVKRFLIHQYGKKVPEGITQINGITSKMANSKDATDGLLVYPLLITDALDAGAIIGHNIFFDTSIIKADILRLYGPKSKEAKNIINAFHKDKRLDTMRMSMRLFGKWPKLCDLYFYLFKEKLKDAHGACSDMLATERCFIELKRRRIV